MNRNALWIPSEHVGNLIPLVNLRVHVERAIGLLGKETSLEKIYDEAIDHGVKASGGFGAGSGVS